MASVATPTITGRLTDALYTEAMLFADELRAYLDGPAQEVRPVMPPQARVLFACEALNATTRIMQVTAHLLAKRAGREGNESLDAADPPPAATLALFPLEAQRLIGIGLELYERVRRMDGGVPQVAVLPSPAHALFQRLERAF